MRDWEENWRLSLHWFAGSWTASFGMIFFNRMDRKGCAKVTEEYFSKSQRLVVCLMSANVYFPETANWINPSCKGERFFASSRTFSFLLSLLFPRSWIFYNSVLGKTFLLTQKELGKGSIVYFPVYKLFNFDNKLNNSFLRRDSIVPVFCFQSWISFLVSWPKFGFCNVRQRAKRILYRQYQYPG